MSSPDSPALPDRAEIDLVLDLARSEADAFFGGLDDRPVRMRSADEAARVFSGALPETGPGAVAALRELVECGRDAVIASAGPRFFHFVIGGSTPAALGADWLTSVYDQLASARVTSPLAVQLELVSLAWLRDLFGLPEAGAGYMTTGAMMANFTCLAAARQWWGEQHGVDIAARGFTGLPEVPVLSSGYLHASSIKALAMLGIGRTTQRLFARDAAGRLDLDALEGALRELKGGPAVLIGNAGEVNAGDFDPIAAMADLAERYGAWLHVDGAFGLFARAAPATFDLAAGVERADSVTADGHKWLNVPYDCGFAFVRDQELLRKNFALTADYLPEIDGPAPPFSSIGPESSRRARAFSVWATLRAYGRAGVRDMVERHLALTRHLARRVDEADDLERLAEVKLNIVCFRYRDANLTDEELDRLNDALGEAVLEDGRVYVGTTRYEGRVALRPAIVNWRTTEGDVDLLVDVVRELGGRLVGA